MLPRRSSNFDTAFSKYFAAGSLLTRTSDLQLTTDKIGTSFIHVGYDTLHQAIKEALRVVCETGTCN